MAKKILFIVVFALLSSIVSAQRTDYPMIGAQVFIEPGQTAQEIESYFSILDECGFKFARIRMFGAHLKMDNGFALYDKAFDAAAKHGIKIFATLFPDTDELNDVGGFKFPYSIKHLDEIDQYIKSVVSHYSSHPAMYCWVLQNEPGTGGSSVPKTDISLRIRAEWQKTHPSYERGDGYLGANFEEEVFLRYYTVWYLNHIAEVVKANDRVGHFTHVNPHGILGTLQEYDFAALENVVSSMGVSMHYSWHFGIFPETEFPDGVAFMSDIIRNQARNNPFWVTEMQGGNVTMSGSRTICPAAYQIEQILWTSIGSGAEGAIFWTLNPRKAVQEAGDWALLNFLNGPSDRLSAAAMVAKTIEKNKSIFSTAKPIESPVSILYNVESLRTQRFLGKDRSLQGRSSEAVVASMAKAYQALESVGIIPSVSDMEIFDWNPKSHPYVLLPNIVSIPSTYYSKLKEYVNNGGNLIITGLSGYFDEKMRCSFIGKHPLADLFGGDLLEYKVKEDSFDINVAQHTLKSHIWKTIVSPAKKSTVLSTIDSKPAAISSIYGKGKVTWIPMQIEIGTETQTLGKFYKTLINKADLPCEFDYEDKDVNIRMMTSKNKKIYVISNSGDHTANLIYYKNVGKKKIDVIFGTTTKKDKLFTIQPYSTVVICFDK